MKLKSIAVALCLFLLCTGAFAGGFDLETRTEKVDWIYLTSTDMRGVGGALVLNPVNSADYMPNAATLFLRTLPWDGIARISLIASSSGSADVTASVDITSRWLQNGAFHGEGKAPFLADVRVNATQDYGIASGDYRFDVIDWNIPNRTVRLGNFYLLKINPTPAVDVRYDFAGEVPSISWNRLPGGTERRERTVDYRGLLEETQTIRIALSNWGPRLYTLATKGDSIQARWIGRPDIGAYSAASADTTLSSGFGASWVIQPFSGERTFSVQLTHPVDEARLYSFRWDPSNTFKRGSFSKKFDGEIKISTIVDVAHVLSKDFGRSCRYIDGNLDKDAVFRPLLVQRDWERLTKNGVKGLSLDVPYTPQSDDTGKRMSVGLLGLEFSLPISWADLLLVPNGEIILRKIKEDIATGTPFADAVLGHLRPKKFTGLGEEGVDLVELALASGKNLRDFFYVRDESEGEAFAATIVFRAVLADMGGVSVKPGDGYFLIRDGKEDARFKDPIVIVLNKSGIPPNNSQPGAGGGGSGCSALAFASFGILLLPLAFLKRRGH